MPLPKGQRVARMNQPKAASRTCPACGSDDYEFRSRKKVAHEAGQGEVVETKYRCKACGHEWRVRVAG
jgi:DNA-directed RNA polymerase subunit M/transcription elongation factor TFIIS